MFYQISVTFSISLAPPSTYATSFQTIFVNSPQNFFSTHFGNKKQLQPTCKKQKQRIILMFAAF